MYAKMANKITAIYGTQKIKRHLTVVNVLSHLNTVHILTTYYFKTIFNILHPSMPMSPYWFFPSDRLNILYAFLRSPMQAAWPDPNILYVFLRFPMHVIWPDHLFIPDLINLTILGEEYRW
jgi:hypothetical protein